MYNLLSLVIGAVVAIMIAINGQLTSAYDLFVSAVIIHVIGTVFSLIVCLCRHQKILVKAEAPWMYLGGAIGVFTTFGNNLSYGRISMTSIVALVLFGQTVISLLIDSFGLMGMEKHPFKKTSVIGLVFALAGMLVMLQPSGGGSNAGAAMAVAASFVTGIFLVLARTVNGRLAEQAGGAYRILYQSSGRTADHRFYYAVCEARSGCFFYRIAGAFLVDLLWRHAGSSDSLSI